MAQAEAGAADGEEDVLAMMQRLGMNIDTDSTDMQYRWIAEAALVQPLPKNWQEHTDPNGYAYFHNLITNETTAQCLFCRPELES